MTRSCGDGGMRCYKQAGASSQGPWVVLGLFALLGAVVWIVLRGRG